MGKIAFIFAGQGAQYVGMGKELAEQYTLCKEIFEAADLAAGFRLSQLCFEGPAEQLNMTENTQPAIVATSIAALKVLLHHGVRPDVTAGLSLGEYAALVCSGVLDFEKAIPLVKKRGKFMQEAVPPGIGTMAAILGLEAEGVKVACQEAREAGVVEPANFNCPGQIVIGGEIQAVALACEKAKEKGAMKTVPLAVSAPFHTSMLAPAAEKLSKELETLVLGEPQIPVITNVTGQYIQSTQEIKKLLTKQVMSAVLWEQTLRQMIADGVDTFVEIGPGKTLSGFVKKIDRKLTTWNVEDIKSLEKTIEALGGSRC